MTAYDSEKFRAEYKRLFGEPTPGARAGLDLLLGYLVADAGMADDRYKAYALATTMHETAGTFQPIEERGKPAYFVKRYFQTEHIRKQLGNLTAEDAVRYAGKGYAQITGRANYERFSRLLGVDLAGTPDLALDPEIAYRIMAVGMIGGHFTGRALKHYFGPTVSNWVGARKIINGTDKAEQIAQLGLKFQTCLLAAKE
ncbi:MAG TPA: glycoside hydrolase family 19 protein [Rhodothermales bacterium]|nr:glycoside hydrolase family 19 protein [Rhodothermales bacterium]